MATTPLTSRGKILHKDIREELTDRYTLSRLGAETWAWQLMEWRHPPNNRGAVAVHAITRCHRVFCFIVTFMCGCFIIEYGLAGFHDGRLARRGLRAGCWWGKTIQLQRDKDAILFILASTCSGWQARGFYGYQPGLAFEVTVKAATKPLSSVTGGSICKQSELSLPKTRLR